MLFMIKKGENPSIVDKYTFVRGKVISSAPRILDNGVVKNIEMITKTRATKPPMVKECI
jgi:hypothetical protein